MQPYYSVMFTKLFAESGLSLDRLRSLLEVGIAGSIVKAADGDPVRQSQYSRQIKELEDFFRIKLIERQDKGTRLTPNGRELARISRFFMLGLSNFQRGCLAGEQTFRIGASATFIPQFLLPALANPAGPRVGTRYAVEVVSDDEIERRLHDLTLDFGVITRMTMSRPLQVSALGRWRLRLWVPRKLYDREQNIRVALREKRLPLVLARKEFAADGLKLLADHEPFLSCDSFLDAKSVLARGGAATILPDFLISAAEAKAFLTIRIPELEAWTFQFQLAWNPRLLRLNPHAIRQRDFLKNILSQRRAA